MNKHKLLISIFIFQILLSLGVIYFAFHKPVIVRPPTPPTPGALTSDLASVHGKKILVTATNRGLGFELVKYLAEKGADVVYTTRRESEAQNVGKILSNINDKGTYKWVQLDLSDDNSINRAAQAANKLGPYDVVVQNAGIMSKDATEQEFQRVYKTNVEGTVKFTEKILPYVKDYGRVVMISSEAGQYWRYTPKLNEHLKSVKTIQDQSFRGKPQFIEGVWPYGLSKAYLNKYIQLASETPLYTERFIQITAVHPGWCSTDMGGKNAVHKPSDCAQNSMYWAIATLQNINGGYHTYGKPMGYTTDL